MPLAFAPDAPDTTPGVLTAVSMVPTVRGYKNPPAPVNAGLSAIAAAAQGGALLRKLDDSVRTIAGTATKLYEAGSSSWTDRSRAGDYSIGGLKWRFAQFGNTSLAINKVTRLQQSSSGAFADVSASPKATLIESVGAFVMLGDIDDTSLSIGTSYGDSPDRVWWSQQYAPLSSWDTTAGTSSAANQAGSTRLVATPGPITGLRRLKGYIVVYKAGSMYIGRNTAPPFVWEFELVAEDIGCGVQEGIVSTGSAHFFIGESDLYRYDGSSEPQPIGAGIKEWFFDRLNGAYRSKIESLHDKANTSVYWFYPSGSSQVPNSCLVFNYVAGRWGAFDIDVATALQAVTSTVTYASAGNLWTTYGDIPDIPYASSLFGASAPLLSVIASDELLYSLTGDGDSSLTTGWVGDEGVVSLCDKLRPKFRVKPTTAVLTPKSTMQLGGSVTTGAARSINTAWWDVLQAANYHGFSAAFTGACEVEELLPRVREESEV